MQKWLRAERVILSNGDELTNRRIFIHGDFLIVDAEAEDLSADWYNLRYVKQMQGVIADIPETPKPRPSWEREGFH